ncbi:uncharacterized protein LOC122077810 isoform X2 [Macadamia integrifolia]|uniref:uncharacterized protein LOC122077810 isoform X2 n=1 Tax=Macadamia integrifolia TaxID=60698 RepID=UPI001C4F827B|nr:uncharacterized protein LOC122077810 isoform X2 [Macadamia integrifolia]
MAASKLKHPMPEETKTLKARTLEETKTLDVFSSPSPATTNSDVFYGSHRLRHLLFSFSGSKNDNNHNTILPVTSSPPAARATTRLLTHFQSLLSSFSHS